MLYNPPTGSTDPSAPFVGKNVAAGIQGSRIPPKAVEMPQRELVNIEVEAGIAPTNDDPKQVLKAIRSGLLATFVATGTVNALIITPTTPHTVLFRGLPFRVFPLYTNTGTATLQVNLLSAPIVRRDGTPLQPGDLVAYVPFDVVYDGVSAFRLTSLAVGEVQRVVPNPVLWVRSDGSDANDGSANDAAHAFATISTAFLASAKLAVTGAAITLRLGTPGTYAAPNVLNRPGGNFIILGDASNQGGYVISGAGGASIQLIAALGCSVSLVGVTVSNTGTLADTVAALAGGSVSVTNVTFTSVAGNNNFHLAAFGFGSATLNGGCIFASSMGGWIKGDGGLVAIAPVPIAFINTPAWGDTGVRAINCGNVKVIGAPTFTGSGATASRYAANTNGVINTAGAGANFFPGSVAGAQANGGVYV